MKTTSRIIACSSFTAVAAMARVGSHSRNLRTAATAAAERPSIEILRPGAAPGPARGPARDAVRRRVADRSGLYAPAQQQDLACARSRSRAPFFSIVADQDPSKPARADLARVPGLLDQYRQQRCRLAGPGRRARAHARGGPAGGRARGDRHRHRRPPRRPAHHRRGAARTAGADGAAARRRRGHRRAGARRCRRSPTCSPSPSASASRARRSDELDITRDVVLEARKGVRSVLDEARAEIEALSAEAPGASCRGHGRHAGRATVRLAGRRAADTASSASAAARRVLAGRRPRRAASEGPGARAESRRRALRRSTSRRATCPFPRSRASSAPTTDDRQAAPGEPRRRHERGFEPLSVRHAAAVRAAHAAARCAEPFEPARRPIAATCCRPTSSRRLPRRSRSTPRRGATSSPASRRASATTEPSSRADDAEEPADSLGTPRFTPPSRLFGDEADTRPPARSARTFVGLFAATGALAVVGTLWWALDPRGRNRSRRRRRPSSTRVKTAAAAPAAATATRAATDPLPARWR